MSSFRAIRSGWDPGGSSYSNFRGDGKASPDDMVGWEHATSRVIDAVSTGRAKIVFVY